MIEVQHLCKTFRVARRGAGFGQAVKTLFHREYEEVKALDDVSFSISEGEMVGYIPPSKSSAESSHRTAVCAASTGGFHGRTGLPM